MSLTISELVEDISDVTSQVWENILSLEAIPVPPGVSTPLSVSSSVQIIGEWNGAVNLSMTPDLALLIASTMFELEPQDLAPDEIDDAVGEMANMIGGNVKSLLPGPSQLSMPTVVQGDHAPSFPGTEVSEHLEFIVEGHPFTVTVLERGAGGEVLHSHATTSTDPDSAATEAARSES